MSIPLWLNGRLFPLIPITDGLILPAPLDVVLLGILGLGLLVNLFLNDKRLQIGTVVVLLLLLVQDQMRWQPWVYTYLLVGLPFLVADVRQAPQHIWILRSVQILLIGIYLWSGLNKFNPGFTEVTYQLMLSNLLGLPTDSALHQMSWLGYLIPVLETAVGVGLFWRRSRPVAVWGAVLTHIVIIAYLFSMGEQGNLIVIPWNIAMIGFVLLAFFRQDNAVTFRPAAPVPARTTKKKKRSQRAKVGPIVWVPLAMALLTWLLPALRLVGQWDNYLSFNLYSDNIKYLYVGVRGEALEALPDQISAYYSENNVMEEGQTLDAFAWSFDELNVPVYPERRVYRAIARYFCEQSAQAPQEYLFIEYRLPFREGNYEVFRCGQY